MAPGGILPGGLNDPDDNNDEEDGDEEDDDDDDDFLGSHRKSSKFFRVCSQTTDEVSGRASAASHFTSHTESWVGKGKAELEEEEEEG